MNNGTPTTSLPPAQPLRARVKPGARKNLLYKMIGVAVAIHLVLILLTSKTLLGSDDADSPEQIFEKGEEAMSAGHYLDAMDLYQQVLNKQPKLPPVFERAAEQHRTADKLAKQQAAKLTATRPSDAPAANTTTTAPPAGDSTAKPEVAIPIKTQPPAAKPDFDVPPELRPK